MTLIWIYSVTFCAKLITVTGGGLEVKDLEKLNVVITQDMIH